MIQTLITKDEIVKIIRDHVVPTHDQDMTGEDDAAEMLMALCNERLLGKEFFGPEYAVKDSSTEVTFHRIPVGEWPDWYKDALEPVTGQKLPYQHRVAEWMYRCFGDDITNSLQERCFRFAEEAGELVQSIGMTEAQWHDIGRYVWGRPIGETPQEVGGVMVTLAALCHASGQNMDVNGETELARINTPEMIEKIRRKHNDKKLRIPTSALPGDAS